MFSATNNLDKEPPEDRPETASSGKNTQLLPRRTEKKSRNTISTAGTGSLMYNCFTHTNMSIVPDDCSDPMLHVRTAGTLGSQVQIPIEAYNSSVIFSVVLYR
jgi:hypothetical protein